MSKYLKFVHDFIASDEVHTACPTFLRESNVVEVLRPITSPHATQKTNIDAYESIKVFGDQGSICLRLKTSPNLSMS